MAAAEAVDNATGETAPESGEATSSLPLRRSSRARKRPSGHDEDADYKNGNVAASPVSSNSRRNRKRRAAPDSFSVPERLLEASLGPWKDNEQFEWPSWVELESDPAFFTAIMGLLGVKGAKIEEVLSVDEDTLATLPAPVHGLVFLYEYVVDESPEVTYPSHDVWFANQTTHNACATIALLNIIMNAERLILGEKLRNFKQESKDLSPPLRGNMINNSTWIRVAHNSFARRLDLLDAALGLQNEVDNKEKKARSSDTAHRQRKKKPKKERGKHWTSVMRPVLQERMMRYETERLSFSLLALCGDNLAQVRQKLAANVRSLADLNTNFGNNPHWSSRTSSHDTIQVPTDARLSAFQLDAEDIQAVPDSDLRFSFPQERQQNSPSSLALDASAVSGKMTVDAALELWAQLSAEQKLIIAEYDNERSVEGGQEPTAILGRTRDYTAAIHEWVGKLAGHGVLRRLHQEVQLQVS
ncbi:hypothetical protein VTH06DRAFT_5782 [Thermothelomyces fergusii]